MAATTMIGRAIVVDELSLIRVGPVRMRFACRAPDKLRGRVEIWFNGEGFDITVEPELAAPGRGPAPAPTFQWQRPRRQGQRCGSRQQREHGR